jgi:DNA-binding NtrC family response regulator
MTSYPMPPNFADHVLVASPSSVVRQRVYESLRSPNRHLVQAKGGAEALVHLETGNWQVLFLDRRLPDLDAEELQKTVRQRFPGIEVVLIDPEIDCELKPKEHADLAVVEGGANGVQEAWPAIFDAPREDYVLPASSSPTNSAPPLPGMIGSSFAMQPVYRMARLLAPRNTAVLITGPTGSGKEIVARAIHQLSPRSSRAFAVVNCAAIPETLLEAELFGYARGAFTGAMQSYAGRIQAAQGGTLFLDEIGEMPLSVQPKLLRFLEQKELQRLGSSEVIHVDARVVSATNAHLMTLVREGKFREDLYHRLCGFPIEIPSLHERPKDIVQLAMHFLEKFSSRLPVPQFALSALALLKSHAWSGNIRELQNVIERALILCEDAAVIRPEHVLLGDVCLNIPR